MVESPPGKGVALVTGASSGLGEQFARQLSARGHELILVARRADRLEKLASELAAPAHVIGLDLAAGAPELRARVDALGLEVDLLVNNAGFGCSGPFVELDGARQAEEVRVNCEAVVTLTHAFVPAMIRRGRGGVIIVASTAGMQPIPYEAVYAATKAFALSFSDALHTELRDTGVRVLAVSPGPVPTEWQEVAGTAGTGAVPGEIPAEQCVREALEAYDRGARSFVPGRVIRWLLRASAPTPRAIQLRITERLYRNRHAP
ncbi:MAG: SDR family NAD(P)-dependent oxidoreductase [Solirubrobacterales bacterium]